MAPSPFISIIIPLYNKERSIQKTLKSVLSQTYTDFLVYVVDDGSTDYSASKVKEIEETDSRVLLISKQNGGVCSARNEGIRQSCSDLIALLDADDLWAPTYLSEQVRMYNDFPQCSMWGINYAETENGTRIRNVPTGLHEGFRGIVSDYFRMPGRVSDLFCSSSVMIRKAVFAAVGMFDERIRFSEDIDMWYRIIARYPVAFYDKYLVYYQFDTENRAMKKQKPLNFSLPYFVDKYKSFKENQIFYRWINSWCAQVITSYYFANGADIQTAKEAASKLDYSVISQKYVLYFKTPYIIGRLCHCLIGIKHKCFR